MLKLWNVDLFSDLVAFRSIFWTLLSVFTVLFPIVLHFLTKFLFPCSELPTGWYPWGIQQLVSTYSNYKPVCSSLNFNLRGGVFWSSHNSKYQDLPKFQLGGGCSEVVKTQSAKICLNFNFQGRGRGFCFRTGCSEEFKHKFCLATFLKPLHHR